MMMILMDGALENIKYLFKKLKNILGLIILLKLILNFINYGNLIIYN